MGQEASKPQSGSSLLVIGAGLPRTGTSSFTEALKILLQGPVHHCGTQVALGPEKDVLGWMDVLRQTPIESEADRKLVSQKLKKLTDGHVAITDAPGCVFVEELMALYPDAKVICTSRDREGFVKSMATTRAAATQSFLRFSLFWLPSLRYFPDYADCLRRRWFELYGPVQAGKNYVESGQVWDKHMDYLLRVVPKEKLIIYDVKDGWEPLCQALNVPVPKNVDFPRINDSKAMEAFAKEHIRRGLSRWAMFFGAVVLVTGSVLIHKRFR